MSIRANKQFYVGDVGPLFYGARKSYALTAPQISLTEDPSDPTNPVPYGTHQKVGRTPVAVSSINDPSIELASISGGNIGSQLVVYEDTATVPMMTIYLWCEADSNVVADPPFLVSGNGGMWVAAGGVHNYYLNFNDSIDFYWVDESDNQMVDDSGNLLYFKDMTEYDEWVTDSDDQMIDESGNVLIFGG